MHQPTISIVTVCFNASSYIRPTIESVIGQSYPAVEYIIVDGKSTDATMDIVHEYTQQISKIVSETDKGIYDAMNKGLALATGQYILYMNGGDRFAHNGVLEQIFMHLKPADVYYGDTEIIDEQWNVTGLRRLRPPEGLTWQSFGMGMLVSHQSFIARRELCPHFDMRYRYSADFDWCIHILRNVRHISNTGMVISQFMQGGTTSKTRLRGLRERWRIMVRHYGLSETLGNHLKIAARLISHILKRWSAKL